MCIRDRYRAPIPARVRLRNATLIARSANPKLYSFAKVTIFPRMAAITMMLPLEIRCRRTMAHLCGLPAAYGGASGAHPMWCATQPPKFEDEASGRRTLDEDASRRWRSVHRIRSRVAQSALMPEPPSGWPRGSAARGLDERPQSLPRATHMLVEFAKRLGVAGGVLQPVDVTGVLQRHLLSLREPASDDLGAVFEDVEGSVEDEHWPLVARRALERIWAFLGDGPVGLHHRDGGTASEPLRVRIGRGCGVQEVVVPRLRHHVTHRPRADRTGDDQTRAVGVEPEGTRQSRPAVFDTEGFPLGSFPVAAHTERRAGKDQARDPLWVGRGVRLSEKSAPGVPQHVPGINAHDGPNAFDVFEVSSQLVAPIETRRFADAALVEADAPELGKHRSS